ncbi:Protein FAR1-RELATED SEQUENCE [Abeliophyllum distichum]|uniref:Protein FAR1-RELATED SEQUENCE n=1 Tax=Abeliophyllum distichum TaxID=126358 RepID=A0ABD1QHV8_9LAMI
MYSMVFGPFVGVNHHGQIVISGCGLLSDEITESFVWLFTKFIEAMLNYAAPGVIITDQDAAIARATSIVLSSTLHRFCMWHILNKFSEKMNVVLYNDQYHMLVHIIKQSESPAEFEQQWIEVMKTTELGMSSSQRSESGHSFLKKYVDRKNSLTDFVVRFNRALVHQRYEELAANHIDLTQTPKNELVQSNSYIYSNWLSSDEAKVYAVQYFEPGRTSDRTHQLTRGSLTNARSTFLLSEFQNLRIRVKDIDTGGDVGMSKNRNKSVKETRVICDPNPVRAKGCGKRLKSGKEKALFQSNRQCRACGTSGHDRRTCPTLQNILDNTFQPQYSQDPPDQQYHAPDPQYAYHAPDSQYAYHAPNPQYAYHTSDPQYAYHSQNPQYSITCSNNASYSLDPWEYDARYNLRH